MTVRELIERLEEVRQEAVVLCVIQDVLAEVSEVTEIQDLSPGAPDERVQVLLT